MAAISIFALPSHAAVERTSGVDMARIIQPMTQLNRLEDFKVTIYDPKLNKKMNWLHATAENDILYLNYTTNPWAFSIMGCMARKHKRTIVLDMDDALWDVLTDNTAYEVFKKGSEGIRNFTAICNEVDYITCTNPYLRNVITHNTSKYQDKIMIFPNFIDLDLYKHRSPFKDTDQIQITHFGSSSHWKSLQDEEFAKGIDRIFREYPNVVFKTIGAFLPKYKKRWGMRYSHDFGDVDVYTWIKDKFPKFMDETDIIVSPLSVNVYNRSKSSIKFLEASSAGKPGVYQRIRQYEEVVKEGKNGFLAGSADEWYQSIKKMVDDKELRQKIGKEAFKTIEKDWTIQGNIKRYADFFKGLMK